MAPIIEKGRRTEVIRYIEPWRTMLSDKVKIRLTFGEFSGIYETTLCKEYELIKQRDYVATWLVDCEDDSAVIVARQRNQALDDIVGIVCVQTCKRMS